MPPPFGDRARSKPAIAAALHDRSVRREQFRSPAGGGSRARLTAGNKGRRHGGGNRRQPNNSGYAVNVYNKTGGKSYTIVDGGYPRQGSRQLAGATTVESSEGEKETWTNDKHWDIQHTESEELPDLPFLF